MTLEMGRIYNMDCIEGMKEMEDRSVDLIVTDPPYLMNYRSNKRTKTEKFSHIQNDKGAEQLLISYIEEYHRILKDDSAIYMFCSWHHIDFFKREFEKMFKLKNSIVWNKNNHGSGDLRGAYAPKHEFVLFGHKGRSLFREKRIPDVMNCAKVPGNKLVHPTEKPIELLEVFIRNNSDVGDVVFDGFAGSGTTAVAALNNQRNFIGFEIDSHYTEIGNERIRVKENVGAAV
ncbi:site-specific DNA-methyltransferase [Bacillus cereus group sp. BfR-BA-01522]|uniref:DNA-methyltransferase n=1 Tax=Bacillus cereus group sp. BfR-BA-01522 TaxID=2920370 RepID=UPI001F5908F8|nr:site-specific DNA-methyltransferase [Bacillus cereus group sp. BfR-BA-01522]